MSGRDLRSFLASHRLQNVKTNEERLVTKFVSGSSSRREYREVDYGRLLEEVRSRREEGERGRRRVEGLRRKGRDVMEASLLKRHREAWERERTRLQEAWKVAVTDLGKWRSTVLVSGPDGLRAFLTDATDYETMLWEEKEKFSAQTVAPIWALRVDLQGWVGGVSEGGGCSNEEREAILHQLELVKEQQAAIYDQLMREAEVLTAEIEECVLRYVLDNGDSVIVRGIPHNIATLEWTDHALRDAMLREFSLLDERCQATLDQLDCDYQDVNSSPNGGWSADDAMRYSFIVSQYPFSLANRRQLYINRLLRELPHKTRQEIVAHESWVSAASYYTKRRKACLRLWAEQRAELVRQVEVAFQESLKWREVMDGVREERERQRQVCRQLSEKVRTWREEKAEVMRIEAEEATREREREEAVRRLEEEQEREARERQKAKVKLHLAALEEKRLAEQESEGRRLAEMKTKRNYQANINRERVRYRALLHSQHEEQRREAEKRARREKICREQLLDQLRQKVKVDVQVDPLRILQATQASLARATSNQESEIQQPLFPLHGFPDQVVMSDMRHKVALALRNIGLHGTEYARRIMAAIPPSHAPRPDQQSSLFK